MWYWWLCAGVVALISVSLRLWAYWECRRGNISPIGITAPKYWGIMVFHGTSAIAAAWFAGMALLV